MFPNNPFGEPDDFTTDLVNFFILQAEQRQAQRDAENEASEEAFRQEAQATADAVAQTAQIPSGPLPSLKKSPQSFVQSLQPNTNPFAFPTQASPYKEPGSQSQSLMNKLPQGKDPSHVTGMQPSFAERLSNLLTAAPEGMRKGLGIYSGYRSPEHQERLWRSALKRYGSAQAARKWVAPPGRSRHNMGKAADLSYNGRSLQHAPAAVRAWIHENAGAFGLRFPLPWEPWHIEEIGAR